MFIAYTQPTKKCRPLYLAWNKVDFHFYFTTSIDQATAFADTQLRKINNTFNNLKIRFL